MQVVVLLIPVSSGVAGEIGSFSKEQGCKAAVATMMGRDPKIVKVKKTKDGIVYLSYRRPDDGKLWAYGDGSSTSKEFSLKQLRR
jgi:hypothetical protein